MEDEPQTPGASDFGMARCPERSPEARSRDEAERGSVDVGRGMVWAILATALAGSGDARFRVSWAGETIVHPGLSGGREWTLIAGERFSTGAALELWTSWHPQNQLAVWARGEWFGRRRGRRGAIEELFVAAGPLHAFWAVPTVRVDGRQVDRRFASGLSYVAAAAGMGFGHELRSRALDHWIVRPQAGVRAPHYHGVGLHFALELGLRLGGTP